MEKSSRVIPKVVAVTYGKGHLRELSIREFKGHLKWGFTLVVITRAGCLQEWLQGELRLCCLLGCLFNNIIIVLFSLLYSLVVILAKP